MIHFNQKLSLSPETCKLYKYAQSINNDATRYIRCFEGMQKQREQEVGTWTKLTRKLGLVSKEFTEEEIKYASIVKNRTQIRDLGNKLYDLEQEVFSICKRLDTACSNTEKVELKQRLLALEELIVHVKIALIQEVHYGYSVLYNNAKKSAKMNAKKAKMMTQFLSEERQAVRNQIDFYSIRNIFQRLEEQRALDSRQKLTATSIPRNVAAATEELIKEFGLEHIFEQKSEKASKEIEYQARQLEVERIKTAVRERVFSDESLDMTYNLHALDEVALKDLKYEDKIQSLLLEIDLLKQRMKELNKSRLFLEKEMASNQNGIDRIIASGLESSSKTLRHLRMQNAFHQKALQKTEKERIEQGQKLFEALEKKFFFEGRLEARKQINDELSNSSYGSALKQIFQKGIDSAASFINGLDPQNTPTLDWEMTDWGRAVNLAQDEWKETFRQAIATLYCDEKRLNTKILVLEKMIKELNAAMSPEKRLYLYSSQNGEETLKAWEQRKDQLESALKQALKERDYTRIKTRERFLQRIITCTGDQHIALNRNADAIRFKQRMIRESQDEINKCVRQISTSDGTDSTEIIRLDQHLIHLQDQLQKRQSELKYLEEERVRISSTLKALEKGFEKHIKIYKSLERPEETFMDQLKGFTNSYIEKMLTLGISDTEYKMPREFEADMEFARFGYTWKEGLKGFTEGDGNVADTLLTHVKDFLKFVDDYPEIAESMLVDITVTISRFNDDTALETLKQGIKKRAQLRGLLGMIGRNVHVRPKLTPEAYKRAKKFKALAELARYAPMAQAASKAAQEGWNGLLTGGLLSAVIKGVFTFATEKAQSELYAQTIKAIRVEDLSLYTAIFGAVLGDRIEDIVAEQRNLALLQLAGTVRYAMKDANLVFHGVKRIFWDQLDAIEHAALPEKIVRIGALVAAPPAIALSGMAISVTLIQFEGLLLGVSFGIVALVMAVSLPVIFLTFAQKFHPFSTTMAAVKRTQAKEFLDTYKEGKLRHDLISEVDEHIKLMRQKGLLAPEFDPSRTSEISSELKTLYWFHEEGEESLHEKIVNRIVNRLNTQLATREGRLSRGACYADVKEIFQDNVKSFKVKAEVKKVVDQFEGGFSKDQKNALIAVYADLLSQDLVDRWLKPHLYNVMEDELMRKILRAENLEKFEKENKTETDEASAKLNRCEETVKEKFETTFREHEITEIKDQDKIYETLGFPDWTRKEVFKN